VWQGRRVATRQPRTVTSTNATRHRAIQQPAKGQAALLKALVSTASEEHALRATPRSTSAHDHTDPTSIRTPQYTPLERCRIRRGRSTLRGVQIKRDDQLMMKVEVRFAPIQVRLATPDDTQPRTEWMTLPSFLRLQSQS
jgi:hypothetical protein